MRCEQETHCGKEVQKLPLEPSWLDKLRYAMVSISRTILQYCMCYSIVHEMLTAILQHITSLKVGCALTRILDTLRTQHGRSTRVKCM